MTTAINSITYNGVTVGPGGTGHLISVQGLTGLPNNRNGDVSRPGAPGMLAGYDYPGDRPIVIQMDAAAGNGKTFYQNLTVLRAAFQMSQTCGGGVMPPAGQVLSFNFGEGTDSKQVCARVRKFDDTVDLAFSIGAFTTISLQLDAVDPLIYDTTLQSASVGLTTPSGGLTFPATFPLVFGAQSGGIITAVNHGYSPCPGYFLINGPCINPRIEQQTTGITVKFNLTLNSGDQLAVNAYDGSAILNGSTSRVGQTAPGSYINTLQIVPGTNQLAFFSDDGVATAATMTAYWRNAST